MLNGLSTQQAISTRQILQIMIVLNYIKPKQVLSI